MTADIDKRKTVGEYVLKNKEIFCIIIILFVMLIAILNRMFIITNIKIID